MVIGNEDEIERAAGDLSERIGTWSKQTGNPLIYEA
jgi:hypothetical protein